MNFELLKVKEIAEGEPIRSPHDVADFVSTNMEEEARVDRECFWILHLNARNQVIEKELTAIGCERLSRTSCGCYEEGCLKRHSSRYSGSQSP